jgi:hypothetical protein
LGDHRLKAARRLTSFPSKASTGAYLFPLRVLLYNY